MSIPDYDSFLAELSALTIKHGLIIGGCGCCGSPYLVFDDENPPKTGAYTICGGADLLTWNEDHHNCSQRQQRRQLRQALLAEANRAEAGE